MLVSLSPIQSKRESTVDGESALLVPPSLSPFQASLCPSQPRSSPISPSFPPPMAIPYPLLFHPRPTVMTTVYRQWLRRLSCKPRPLRLPYPRQWRLSCQDHHHLCHRISHSPRPLSVRLRLRMEWEESREEFPVYHHPLPDWTRGEGSGGVGLRDRASRVPFWVDRRRRKRRRENGRLQRGYRQL